MDTLDHKYLLEKFDVVFDSRKCAAQLNLAFAFRIKNVEDGSWRYCYAHDKSTLLERSKLVVTTEDLTKTKTPLSNNDVFESCTKEQADTKWKFYKLTIVTFFAALLKEVPMGCKDTVLPDPLLKNHSVKCFRFEENFQTPYNDNLSPWSSGGEFAWKLETRGGNFHIVQPIPRKNWRNWSCKLLRPLYGRYCSSRRCCSGRYGYYVIIIISALPPISTLSSKPIVVQRVINSTKRLVTWSDISPFAKKELNMFFQSTCINCEKHCFTSQTCSISLSTMT